VAFQDEDEGEDTTPRPLARSAAPEPDVSLLAPPPPPPALQETQFVDTSFNPFSEPNTTGRNRSRSQQGDSQVQHMRTEEVIDPAKSDNKPELNDSPRDFQDEYVRQIAELEEMSKRRFDAMEARLAEIMEDIRTIEDGLHTVGSRVRRALEA